MSEDTPIERLHKMAKYLSGELAGPPRMDLMPRFSKDLEDIATYVESLPTHDQMRDALEAEGGSHIRFREYRDCVLDMRSEDCPESVMTPEEMECMKSAGRDAGGYISNLGKTDMKTLTKEEWVKFISLIVLGFELNMASRENGLSG